MDSKVQNTKKKQHQYYTHMHHTPISYCIVNQDAKKIENTVFGFSDFLALFIHVSIWNPLSFKFKDTDYKTSDWFAHIKLRSNKSF